MDNHDLRVTAIPVKMVQMDLHLTYIYDPANPFGGNMSMSGPVGAKTLCYMMLELAREGVMKFDPNKQGPDILLAKGFPGLK